MGGLGEVRVAACQFDVAFGQPERNAERAVDELESLAENGTLLAVFPEAYLTGYVVDSPEEARRISIQSDDPALTAIRQAVDRTGVTTVVGYAEARGDRLYNTAEVFVPGETPRRYRKSHLPCLGLDRFVEPGDELEVFETPVGTVGVLVCYDVRQPEPARVLALKGAQMLVLPTNWPEGADFAADSLSAARAAENKVWFLSCNRVGEESGVRFIGKSGAFGLAGHELGRLGSDEGTLVVDLEPEAADDKLNVRVPGKYQAHVFETRRPDLYGALVDPI